jgi:uncharacterized membrane protein YphA (DoxX/SURF4 family)
MTQATVYTRDTTLAADRMNPSKAALWTGWILSILPCLLLFFSATGKFLKPKQVIEGFEHLGWSPNLALALGIVEVSCTILYLFPRTAILGAILLTGYLGGAAATHVRVGESWITPVVAGVVLWLGLFLREPRLRPLVPWRK